jgi:hypothetical protein
MVIGIAGLTLLAGFFLPWLSVSSNGWSFSTSAYGIVRAGGSFGALQLLMIAVPLAGVAMFLSSLRSVRGARLVSLLSAVGLGALAAYNIFSVTGWGLWIVVAAGFVALLAPFMIARDRG